MTYFSFFISELKLAMRRKQDIVNALVFFLMIIALFPLGITPSPDFLSVSAGGIVWCSVTLSILMAIETIFKEDFYDGSLEQLVVSGLSLSFLVLIKAAVQWLILLSPLLILSPLVASILFLPWSVLPVLIVSLLLGSPALFLIGTIGAALTLSLRKGAVLMLLVILPFYLPVIIFATGAITAAQTGENYTGQLALLAAISLVALALSPFMTAISIKASVN